MTHPTTTPPPVVSVTVLHTAARLIRDYTQCGQHLDGALRDELDHDAEFWVRARDGNRFIRDLVPHYNRGRARVPLRPTRPDGAP